MITSILGIKMKQTQTFSEAGKRLPTTVVSAGPCFITAISDTDGKGYVQIGFGTRKSITKPIQGIVKKAGIQEKPRFFRQIDVGEVRDFQIGQCIKAGDVFAPGDEIAVTGVSKGKGFAGVMKRHGFHGGPATHGQSDRARSPGSIGQTTTPGRVYRGKRMAGRMGQDTVTVKGLSVVSVDSDNNTMVIRGLVPGGKNALVIIHKVK